MAETAAQSNAASPTQTAPSPSGGAKQPNVAQDSDLTAKFRGPGTNFRGKLIGVDDVPESRGDKMCQDSIIKLKGNIKVSGQHKQKIVINISFNGIKLIDLMTGQVLHEHRVERISFIARDLTDRRAFGYIFGDNEGKHRFFAIKTAKVAEQVVLELRDLFQVIFSKRKKEMEVAKQASENPDSSQETQSSAVDNAQTNAKQEHILNLEQQVENMQQGMSDMDAFKSSVPATPGTPSQGAESDMFGMANLSDISSLSSEFSMPSSAGTPRDSVKSRGRKESKDSVNQANLQVTQNFQRTSSQKSAASWNGSTSDTSSLTQKRHASLTVTRAKELKETLPEYIAPTKNDIKKAKADADSSTKETSQKQEPDGSSETVTMPTAEDKDSDGFDDSFFNEVMAATGIATVSIPTVSTSEDSSYTVAKTPEAGIGVSHDVSGSMSSISSSSSKTSSHRSLSIGNLFFSKSDKKKSSVKSGKKSSRQSSISSVVSVTEKPAISPCDTISDSKSSGSAENVHTHTSSTGSINLQRKLSSSSSASNDKVMSKFSPTQTDDIKPRSHTVRERPSAAVARARPRAARAQTVVSDAKNPPMFKTKSITEKKSDEKVSLDQSSCLGSPETVRSSQSTVSKDLREDIEVASADPATPTTPTPAKPDADDRSWAHFKEATNDVSDPSKFDDSFVKAKWETSVVEKVPEEKSAWDTFNNRNDVQKSETKNVDIAGDSGFSDDPFTDGKIFSNLDNKSIGGDQSHPDSSKQANPDAWNAFADITSDGAKPNKNEFENTFNDLEVDSPKQEDSWNAFNDQKIDSPKQEDSWNAFNDQKIDSPKQEDSWNAFNDQKMSSPKHEDSWNAFDNLKVDSPKQEDSWNAFGEASTATVNEKSDFTSDPFTNDPQPFQDVRDDPFGDLSLTGAAEDPFQNVESVFGISCDSTENKTTYTPDVKDHLIAISSNDGTINRVFDEQKKRSRSNSNRSSVGSYHSSASSRQSPTSCADQTIQEEKPTTTLKANPIHQTHDFPQFQVSFPEPFSQDSFFGTKPPPLPPRPPRRSSTLSEEEAPFPPALPPPPPLPSRPHLELCAVNEVSSSSEEEEDEPGPPPCFEPPQLPAHLKQDFSSHESFEQSVADAHSTTNQNGPSTDAEPYSPPPKIRPPDLPQELTDSIFNLPFKTPATLEPPKIPKRQVPTPAELSSSLHQDKTSGVQVHTAA